MNKKRLKKLKEFLENLDSRKFDLGIVAMDVREGKCCSQGCAMGWMPTVFPKSGLLLKLEDGYEWPIVLINKKTNKIDFEAAADFFDITINISERLFDPYYYDRQKGPKSVAKKIGKLLDMGEEEFERVEF